MLTILYDKLTHTVIQAYNLRPVYPSHSIWTSMSSVFSCSTLSDSVTPWTVALQASSVHGISQASILEWVAISFSRGLPGPGIEPTSPWQAHSLPLSHLGSPWVTLFNINNWSGRLYTYLLKFYFILLLAAAAVSLLLLLHFPG